MQVSQAGEAAAVATGTSPPCKGPADVPVMGMAQQNTPPETEQADHLIMFDEIDDADENDDSQSRESESAAQAPVFFKSVAIDHYLQWYQLYQLQTGLSFSLPMCSVVIQWHSVTYQYFRAPSLGYSLD